MKEMKGFPDYLKACRKGSREAEFLVFGRALSHHKVHQSEKVYNRKKYKASSKGLPFDLFGVKI